MRCWLMPVVIVLAGCAAQTSRVGASMANGIAIEKRGSYMADIGAVGVEADAGGLRVAGILILNTGYTRLVFGKACIDTMDADGRIIRTATVPLRRLGSQSRTARFSASLDAGQGAVTSLRVTHCLYQ